MSFPEMLYTLLIGPLETLFEIIYIVAYKLTDNPGLSIIGLSLVMNFLLLPLYNRTDAIQLEAIAMDKKLKPYVTHIKKTFQGNEQFMMLQTCYRQNNYKPTDALKGISPLMLEIPFFMAAYNYLSGLGLLNGAVLGPIVDLGAPDGLMKLGGLTLNALPILMTLINILSSLIYTREAPLKTKLQLYGMAALFLVLLYDCPAGLVFYWTLNNLFSLVKNILVKTGKPLAILAVGGTLCSLPCVFLGVRSLGSLSTTRVMLIFLVAVMLNLPMAGWLLGKFRRGRKSRTVTLTRKDRNGFICAGLVLTLSLGLLIPSALVHTSPEEFLIKGLSLNPNVYVLHNALIAAGLFLVWGNVFYALSKPAGKKWMELILWVAAAAVLTDYMAFGKDYGNMSSGLTYDLAMVCTSRQILLNLGALALAAAVVALIWAKKPELLRMVGLAVVIAMAGMSSVNLIQSQKTVSAKLQQMENSQPSQESLFTLSREGENVVVLMLDRAVGSLIPYIFEELPQLQEQFDGFTYYPNTLSFGSSTNFGLPSVMGGYEYTPYELNKRDGESLASKQNEALRVMPVLFSDSGFRTTVCDPTYAGYNWIPDLSIYDDHPEISKYITMGNIHPITRDTLVGQVETTQRKFLFYSLFKASPVLLHDWIYDDGQYQQLTEGGSYTDQVVEDLLHARGENSDFAESRDVLQYLPQLTEITDSGDNTFLMMCNETTHSPEILQLPDYVPAPHVDNSDFDLPQPERTTEAGDTIVMTQPYQVSHYHVNAAAYLLVGQWLDYLRDSGVYDNTRIIIVSDHGYPMHLDEERIFGEEFFDDVTAFNPVLLVKDFGATGFRTDETFMTNADVPALALGGLIPEPVNPFTGMPINMLGKEPDPLYVFRSTQWDVSVNNGNTFLPDPWAAVYGGSMERADWELLEKSILP